MLRIKDFDKCRHLLHDYVIVHETNKLLIERCKFCGKRVKFFKKNGKVMDLYRYSQCHVRDQLQFRGNTKYLYKKIYGKQGQDRINEMEKQHYRKMEDAELLKGYEGLIRKWL